MPADELPPRFHLLTRLHDALEREGSVSREAVAGVAASLRIPLAEAWEAATSYPMFRFELGKPSETRCGGLSCALNGAAPSRDPSAGCRFRCFDAPVDGAEEPFPEERICLAGPLLADDVGDWKGLVTAQRQGTDAALDVIEAAGLRGRGGAYFPVATKWRGAIAQRRPIALVVNAEEGEPGVFKDRALLQRRPRRFIEGLAIAAAVLRPTVIVVFVNGEAAPMREALTGALRVSRALLPVEPLVVSGGGGYVLGEETTLLNALEGRKPVPRLRPPFPVESGLFGMPTVVNNVETIAQLSVVFRGEAGSFRSLGTQDAPGTKLFSLSGRVKRPGLYEMQLGSPLRELVEHAGGAIDGPVAAVLAGGPSGGFLPEAELDRLLLPGMMHATGAVAGSGGMVVLDSSSDLHAAVLAMAAFNADESCGKCTPCREGLPRLLSALQGSEMGIGTDDLLEVVGLGSLCGLGQMAPGPIRSARHFWPELFA
ncbi:MAG: NADH-ubiquinone oxidoreductase-F iron-sulfur binding region domain-containing protein [Anaerolineaceae bacterium]